MAMMFEFSSADLLRGILSLLSEPQEAKFDAAVRDDAAEGHAEGPAVVGGASMPSEPKQKMVHAATHDDGTAEEVEVHADSLSEPRLMKPDTSIPLVIDDGADLKQVVIKGWASEPQFQDQWRLKYTANRIKFLNMMHLRQLRDELGECKASTYVDIVIAELQAYVEVMEPLILHTMQIHTFVQRLASIACHAAVEKMPLNAAYHDFQDTVRHFVQKTVTGHSMDHLKHAIAANDAARKSLQCQGSEGQGKSKAMVAGGACCIGLAVYCGTAGACIGTVKATLAATNPCLAWLTKTVHSVSITTHTTGAGWFEKGTVVSTTNTSTNIVYQAWASKTLCSAGLGSLLGATAFPLGYLHIKESSSSCNDAQFQLERVRKALAFLKEEWNGLHVSCQVLIDYFSGPDPKTFKMLGMECGSKLLAARNSIEKFMVMMWMTQSLPANVHDSIPRFLGEDRFTSIRKTLDDMLGRPVYFRRHE